MNNVSHGVADEIKKVLIISKPYIKNENEKTRICATLSVNEVSYEGYFEVDKKYEEFLTPELTDGFLVNVLLYAMEHNYNIECKGEISEKLSYQISNYLMPAISRNIPKYKIINIRAKLVNYAFKGNGVGTGLSCGVDSFYTVLKHLNNKEYTQYNLSHLCYFNAGASGGLGGNKSRELFIKRGKIFEESSKKLGCNFICVDTNMNEFISQVHEETHTFRTLAIPLIMQKLFNKYLFSSGSIFSDFNFSEKDSAYYDLLTLPHLSTLNTEFILVGAEAARREKIDFISNFEITYSDLNVCVSYNEKNCCCCPKCRKTMLDLYLLGKLDLYKNIFDTESFYKNKSKLFAWALLNKNKFADMHEIIKGLKAKKEITILHHAICLVAKIRNQFRKIF